MISPPCLCASVRKIIEQDGALDAYEGGELRRSITKAVPHGGTEARSHEVTPMHGNDIVTAIVARAVNLRQGLGP